MLALLSSVPRPTSKVIRSLIQFLSLLAPHVPQFLTALIFLDPGLLSRVGRHQDQLSSIRKPYRVVCTRHSLPTSISRTLRTRKLRLT